MGIHPAFRDAYHQAAAISANSCMLQTASGDVSSGPHHQSPMEIDQITSLVSIFSFGQQIMAAAAASSSSNGGGPAASNQAGVDNSTLQSSSLSSKVKSGDSSNEEDEDEITGDSDESKATKKPKVDGAKLKKSNGIEKKKSSKKSG